MIRLFTLLFFIAFGCTQAQAQTPTIGDYRSITSGPWSGTSTWEVKGALTDGWATTSTPPTSTSNVYIQSGHAITVSGAISCNDLHLHTDASLAIGANTLSVSGKIRAWVVGGKLTTNEVSDGATATLTTSTTHGFTAGQSVKIIGITAAASTFNKTSATIIAAPTTTTFTYTPGNATVVASVAITAGIAYLISAQTPVTGSADGTFYTAQTAGKDAIINNMITASGAGVLKFVGNDRTILASTDWTGLGLSTCPIEFALTAGQTGTLSAAIKASSIVFSSGTTFASGVRIIADAASFSGNVTIKSGATFRSSNSGTVGGGLVISGNGIRCGTLTIESNATFELSGGTPAVAISTCVNNGTVVYNTGSVNLLGKSTTYTGSIDITSYKDITLIANSAINTPASVAVNISGALTLAGGPSTRLAYGSGGSVTYTAGTGTFILNENQTFSVTATSPEWPSSNGPTNVTVSQGTLFYGAFFVYNVALTSNVATITTTIPHLFTTGQSVTLSNISINGSVFNGSYTIASVPTTNTFTFAKTNADIASGGVSGAVVLTGTNYSRTITGTLTLSGKVTLGDNSLTVGAISGGSSTAYVVTNGTGVLKQTNVGSTAVSFPIGTATEYLPITSFSNSGTADEFGAKVSATAPSCVLAAYTLTATWDVSETNAGGSNVNMTVQYNNSTGKGASYNGTTAKLFHCNGATPDKFGNAGVSGANPYTILASGFTSFSPFGISSDAVLSVELTDFQVKRKQTSALLTWTTASEKNNATFNIEQSTNGTDFQNVGQVKGSGTTAVETSYTFEHTTPSVGVNYYRLKQVDFNGTATYSAVRSVVFGKNGLAVKTTLVHDALDVVVSDEAATPLSIFNISGQQVLTLKAQGTQRLDVSSLPAGLYIIRTGTGDTGRFVKQ